MKPGFVREVVLRRERVNDFGRYPFNLPAIVGLDRLALHPSVTFLVGENGSGKFTLLEAIAVALGFNAEGGSRNFRFGTRESHSELHSYLTVVRSTRRLRDGFFLRAESVFTVATEVERRDVDEPGDASGPKLGPTFGARPLHEQSHGEAFLAIFGNRLHGNGLCLLDEPEAALSPMRQLTMLTLMHRLATAGAQLVVATHSPILLAYPNAAILHFGRGPLARVAYEETEHFTVTRDFLNRYPAMLRILLADDDAATDSRGSA